MAAMTAEELRAAIEATRRQTEAEEARGAEITVESPGLSGLGQGLGGLGGLGGFRGV